MNKFNKNNRDFFEIYAKAKHDKKTNKHKLKLKSKHKKLKKFFATLLIFLTIIAIAILAIFHYFFGNFKTNHNFEKTCENLGLTTMDKINDNIINIALFGVDKRKEDKNGRSDATIVLTLDGLHKKIKLTTLMRDSRLKIDNHGYDKLCHAYSYGGAKLAVKTINKNFNLDIHDYVTVNFDQMAKIIDAIGGLDVEITRAEVNSINGLLNSTPNFKKNARVKKISGSKQYVHLDGAQVLQYTRIRDIDSDIKRAERQQYILNLIFEKLKRIKKIQYPNILRTLLQICETSLKFNDIIGLTPFITKLKSNSIEKCKIPDPNDTNFVNPGKINGTWYWTFDLDKYKKVLYNFIYLDKNKKTPFKT